MSKKIEKIDIIPGVTWVSIPQADLRILCGCPEDIIKHLIKSRLIKEIKKNGVSYETGPNAILLSELPIMNGKFTNLSEFPILQMLYKQGMIIPNHPNNNGQKPIIIGHQDQLTNQMEYIHRGNYGLISQKEIMATGIDQNLADKMMRLKLKFAFGKIQPTENLLDSIAVDSAPTEIKNQVYIRRLNLNRFEINYQKDKTIIDLNLKKNQTYPTTYFTGNYRIQTGYFSIIHSGEGDGWDPDHPAMASILVFEENIYLIDAGPNLLTTLDALGISISSIKGVFQSHCHDDHFAGLTTLIQSDHRLEYFATSLVRSTVERKLSALLGEQTENILERYFIVRDLDLNNWNHIGLLSVKPLFSPHPVETTNFLFQAQSEDKVVSYYHMADTISFDALSEMTTNTANIPGIDQEFLKTIQHSYLLPADIKKIDIGGRPIHGEAKDFIKDKSKKIVLAHTNRPLTEKEKKVGCRVPFGSVDTLIPNYYHQSSQYSIAKKYLRAYFKLDESYFSGLLNCRTEIFSAGSDLLSLNKKPKFVYLTLTGTVEMIQSRPSLIQQLAAGSLVGSTSVLLDNPNSKSYIAKTYVEVLAIPAKIFLDFIRKYRLGHQIIKIIRNRNFLSTVPLFNGIAYSPPVNSLSLVMQRKIIRKGTTIAASDKKQLIIVVKGELTLYHLETKIQNLKKFQFCFEETITTMIPSHWHIIAKKDSEIAVLPGFLLQEIPIVLWRLYEAFNKKSQEFKRSTTKLPSAS